MKIVAYSNFDIETVSEWAVAENIKAEWAANVMLKALRATVHDNDPYYYKIVPDGYNLYRWEP